MSMKVRLLPILATAAALCACSPGGERGGERTRNGASAGPPAPAEKVDSAAGNTAAGSSQLEQQVAFAAQLLQGQVPIRQGPVTITAAEAKGAELITSMTLTTADLTEASAEQFRTTMIAQQCANPAVRQQIDRGARYTYRITDSGGETFTMNVAGCP